MNVTIRPETTEDNRIVEELTREAFWNLYVPGCDEHYLCHILRDHDDFLPELDYVAEVDGKVVASIMYSRSYLIGDGSNRVPIVSFGPLCVHPDYQRQGIGTALIDRTRKIAEGMGFPAILIYGDPHNYCKHGFRNGIDYRVSDMNGDHPLGLLVLELRPGFFGREDWKAKQSDVFMFSGDEALAFDTRFSPKEKRTHYSQVLFGMQIRSFLRPTDPPHASGDIGSE